MGAPSDLPVSLWLVHIEESDCMILLVLLFLDCDRLDRLFDDEKTKNNCECVLRFRSFGPGYQCRNLVPG